MKDFFKSFRFAFQGIISAFGEERNLRVHCIALVIVVAAGFYFHIQAYEWLVIVLCTVAVIASELLNTAIENLVDLVTTEHKPLAGKVKDIAAGAVLVTSIGSIVAGVIIFYKYIVVRLIL